MARALTEQSDLHTRGHHAALRLAVAMLCRHLELYVRGAFLHWRDVRQVHLPDESSPGAAPTTPSAKGRLTMLEEQQALMRQALTQLSPNASATLASYSLSPSANSLMAQTTTVPEEIWEQLAQRETCARSVLAALLAQSLEQLVGGALLFWRLAIQNAHSVRGLRQENERLKQLLGTAQDPDEAVHASTNSALRESSPDSIFST